MRRRAFFLWTLSAFAAAGDTRTDALDIVAPLATALSTSDADSFQRFLPKGLPNRSLLRDNIAALMAQAEVTSSVEVISTAEGAAVLDWYLEIRSRQNRMVLERRREKVAIRYRKGKLLSLEPASLFAPWRPK